MNFSNNGNGQMLPPPPLPKDMTVVRERAGRMAPPPPPLPEGMTILQEDAGKVPVAPPPPPPPIPNEMLKRARVNPEKPMAQSDSEPIQVQPSQSVFAGMVAIPSEANMENLMSSTRGGRPTMSLTDAVSQKAEAERKAEEEAAKPKVCANGGRLDVDDYCYARSGSDGLYYYAKVEQFDNEKAELSFFDDAVETIIFSSIYTVGEAAEKMQCFANWNSQGIYYPAKIQSISNDKFLVSYDENPELLEELSYDLVRFAPW